MKKKDKLTQFSIESLIMFEMQQKLKMCKVVHKVGVIRFNDLD